MERKHNQDQLFMYYKSPKLDWGSGHVYQKARANSGGIVHNNP